MKVFLAGLLLLLLFIGGIVSLLIASFSIWEPLGYMLLGFILLGLAGLINEQFDPPSKKGGE